jgi:CheY-like chemotaxis protein
MQPQGPSSLTGAPNKPGAPSSTLADELSPLDGFTVVGVLGAELATPVATMQQVVQDFISTRKISSLQMQRLASQQMSRVASGKLRQSHERLSLNGMLKDVVRERQRQFTKRGIEFKQALQTVDVMLDPGLLSSLLDAALDWAVAHGNRIHMLLELKGWSQNAVLSLQVSQQLLDGVPALAASSISDVLLQLLLHLAKQMDLKLSATEAGAHQVLSIEFPRTMKNIQSQVANAELGPASRQGPASRLERASSLPPSVFVGSGFSPSSLPSDSRLPLPYQLLLITSDTAVSSDVRMVCRNLRLTVDTVPSAQSALRFCKLARPSLVLVDELQQDDDFRQLCANLMASQPDFPFIEIASAGSYLSVFSWSGESLMRISRENLRDQLPSVLSQEIRKLEQQP